MSSRARNQSAKVRVDELIRRFTPPLDCCREPYWRLIRSVRSTSQLLAAHNCVGSDHWQDCEQFVSACARIATHEKEWHRVPEHWTAPHANAFEQFRHLANHLFAAYPLPTFMVRAWFAGEGQDWERRLYLHLAKGHSVRRFQLPFPWCMSKASARFFMQAPDDLSPITAFRWAQIRALSGDDGLARLLLTTILVAPSDNEEFWETVIRFVIREEQLSHEEIVEIVGFIHDQRFRPAEVVWGRGAGPEPLQPEFSLCGKSLAALRRHMIHWRAERMAHLPALTPVAAVRSWSPTPIRPFRFEDAHHVWTIKELLSDRELQVEGGIMKHCVASYVRACAQRRTSIWSMQVQHGDSRKRVLTVEVTPGSKLIWQAKGKWNSPPTQAAWWILSRWSEQEGLRFRETT
jgi:hypothetical protein